MRLKRWILLAGIAVLLIILIVWEILRGRASSGPSSNEGSASFSADQSSKAPTETEILQSVNYFDRCGRPPEDLYEPQGLLIRTKQDLSEIEKQHQDSWPAQYYDAFFTDSDMLLITIWESSATFRHEVQGVRLEDGKIVVDIIRLEKYPAADVVEQWDIVIQCSKNRLPEGEIDIRLTTQKGEN